MRSIRLNFAGQFIRFIVYSLMVSLAILPLSGGQGQAKPMQDQSKSPSPPAPKGTGRLHVTPMPTDTFSSLKGLCNGSSLIIDGVVKTTFPSRETSPGSLETDAVITVKRVLKGSAATSEIVISQRGGVASEYQLRPAQYSMVRPGEQYLLFLRDDPRTTAPAVDGLKRYLVAGAWSGLFYFENGAMRVIADEPDQLRMKYSGLSLIQVINAVTEALLP